MARTVTEIKKSMTSEFMKNSVIIAAYNAGISDVSKQIPLAGDFDAYFPKVSMESLLFYIFASAAYLLEVLFDTHKDEVEELLDEQTAHTPKWYRDKALDFMKDKTLIEDTDQYDTEDMSDSEISDAKIISYAAAVEITGSSVLVLKIASGEVGSLAPVSADELTQFKAYINQIKDAGVKYNVINQAGDDFACKLVVYYNATLLESDMRTAILAAIEAYLQGLPFNGEYSNMALIDAIQTVEGVEIADFKKATYGVDSVAINEKATPTAGYFTYTEANIDLILSAYGE